MAIHFINCTEDIFKNKYSRLYRFVTLDQFFKQLDSKKLTFISPLKWNDPFEKYFFERNYMIKNEMYNLQFKDNIYALCFSSIANSEAFWNIYAPNFDGVRIGIESDIFLSEFLNKIKNVDVFIGPVKYYSTADIYKKEIDTKMLVQSLIDSKDLFNQVQLLYRKRSAFEYENEVRVMIIPKRPSNGKEIVGYPYDFVHNAFSISLDPRIGKNHFRFIKENLLMRNGLQVSKASLYDKKNPSVWTLE